jgi:hypothetical protein
MQGKFTTPLQRNANKTRHRIKPAEVSFKIIIIFFYLF